MATRVTSTRIVGRQAELAELRAALAEAAEGRPSLAFLAGESGVGKSRLLSELLRVAREEGAVVLTGDAVELGEGELPYAAIVAALRPLARAEDPVLAALPADARAELATLMPGAGGPAAPRAPREEERGAAQRRLFEALLALLDRLGGDRPVVLALEDVHWADPSTRAFLAFLASSLCTEHVLVVLTYRSDELHRRHPLRPLLAELERAPFARRIELARLLPAELAEQLEDILGAPPSPDLVDRMATRSEGNPLFVEELLAAGLDGRGGLPPTLRDALMLRVERLSDSAQDALRLLAAGRRLDHEILAEASGMDSRVLRDALREAIAGHIALVNENGHYVFRHALLREAIDDDLLPGERAELHLSLARAFAARAAADESAPAWMAARIAEHYRAAGDQPAELEAAVRAAEEARRVLADGEAASLLDRALELYDRVPDAAQRTGVGVSDLLLRAAESHYGAGDVGRAVHLAERAVDGLDGTAQPRRVAAALGRLAVMRWGLGRGEKARDTVAHALAMLPADEPSRERAVLLVTQVRFLMLQGRYLQTFRAADEALEAIAAADAEDLRATVLNKLGVALLVGGEPERGIAALREAIELAHATGSLPEWCAGYTNLSDGLHALGRSEEAIAVAHEGLALLDPGLSGTRWLSIAAGEIAFDMGDWDEARERISARPSAAGAGRANALLRAAELWLGEGDTDAARGALDDIDAFTTTTLEAQFIGVAGTLRADLDRRTGDLQGAREAVEDTLDRLEFCTEDVRYLARIAAMGVAVEADTAEWAADLGDDAARADALARIEPLLLRLQAAAEEDPDRPVEAAHLADAEAERTRAEGHADPAAFAAAADAWITAGRPYCAARARLQEAQAHVGAGDRDAATTAVCAALQGARALGSRWLAEQAQALAARARLRLDEAPDGDAPADDVPDELPFGLTPRELQVLALVARGATNREVGAELYMAEKTASVHVSRILSKLDVRSRTEAAAVAHRHGLAEAVR